MSRYGDYSPRGPPAERWTPQRFERERGGRRTEVLERDRIEERERDYYTKPAGAYRRESSADAYYNSPRRSIGRVGERVEDDRFYEREERYGPPARRFERRTYEEEDDYERLDRGPVSLGRDRFYEEDRRYGGGRGSEPRPGMLIRRQSSLDAFDRRPPPRYGPGRRTPPEIIPVPGPERRRRYSPGRFYEQDYEDIRIAEPDRYGDDNFRGWKEREVETIRRRRMDDGPGFRGKEIVQEEEIIEEKPFPRRGRTRMSARLVNKRAVVELGYPFEEEITDEGSFVIILKALNKELIDEVLYRSRDYNERESRTTLLIEAPPPPEDRGEIVERREIVIDKGSDDVPRSVRDWDVMSGALSVSKSDRHRSERHHSHSHAHRSRSHARSHSRVEIRGRSSSGSGDRKQLVIERKPSRHRRSSSHVHRGEVVEAEEVGESNRMTTGPLALAVPVRTRSRRPSRATRDEIVELELEKKRVRSERKSRRRHHHHHHRPRSHSSSSSSSSSSSPGGEVLIERRSSHGHGDRTVKVEKDRKDSRIIKGMLATLT